MNTQTTPYPRQRQKRITAERKPFTIYLTDEQKNELEQTADQRGLSKGLLAMNRYEAGLSLENQEEH
ncbi:MULTISPECIES: hypothetical protein [unclassified Acinetobacter]|uniref:hypothetical protein n=1 Tax=unclassified Acinetobacter TaxID=196816 RepID=UPI00190E0734|nr:MULTISPECIES: hypothetical protein [unclassified Acinetobacter]MBK0062597.1 hypothetical protein [Acinetobacter sp. S55]MBK0065826.1 hypothetical protein [Acinetobacter sp. S54]